MSTRNNPVKHYPKEFREKAVQLVTTCGYSIDQVAKQVGCSPESVRRWKLDATTKLDPETSRRMENEESETKRLRKEVARLQMEVNILKKATAYFAREVM